MSNPLESLQQNISNELMAAWRHGCRDGLTMASRMAGATLAEVEQRLDSSRNAEDVIACHAQAAVLRALQDSCVVAAEGKELA